jgi:hypothetical protein
MEIPEGVVNVKNYIVASVMIQQIAYVIYVIIMFVIPVPMITLFTVNVATLIVVPNVQISTNVNYVVYIVAINVCRIKYVQDVKINN